MLSVRRERGRGTYEVPPVGKGLVIGHENHVCLRRDVVARHNQLGITTKSVQPSIETTQQTVSYLNHCDEMMMV